jgi:LysR family transcriptional regulator, regulator for bpeEF and oprC
MDKLGLMEIFVRIVETGSFSAVAREMAMSQPTVSKQIGALERSLKTRLLNRTTRSLSLTEAGAAYYERCRKIIDQVQAAETSLGAVKGNLGGTLSVNSSVAFGQMFLTRLVLDFQRMHPDLSVVITFNDRYIDLVEEGIDVAIRFGRVVDAGLVARRVASSPVALAAAPEYLSARGYPSHPSDLARHSCLHYTYLSTGNEWIFPSARGEIRVRISGTFRSNNGYALRDAMLAGHGIAIMPLVFIQSELESGRVVALLPEFTNIALPVNAVYPAGRYVPDKVRGFVDFIQARLPAIPGLQPA